LATDGPLRLFRRHASTAGAAGKSVLSKYQKREPTLVTLRDMLAWSDMQHSAATSKLLTVELLTRLAHRIGDLEQFPTPVLETVPVSSVVQLYSLTFHNLADFYHSNPKWDEKVLTSLLRTFKDRDSSPVYILVNALALVRLWLLFRGQQISPAASHCGRGLWFPKVCFFQTQTFCILLFRVIFIIFHTMQQTLPRLGVAND
jgi:hypothetical protein